MARTLVPRCARGFGVFKAALTYLSSRTTREFLRSLFCPEYNRTTAVWVSKAVVKFTPDAGDVRGGHDGLASPPEGSGLGLPSGDGTGDVSGVAASRLFGVSNAGSSESPDIVSVSHTDSSSDRSARVHRRQRSGSNQ